MNNDELSNTFITDDGDITHHIEKEEIYLMLANSIPEKVQIKDVLSGAIIFLADIIHQMDPENKAMILEVSKNMLDCEYRIIQDTLKSE